MLKLVILNEDLKNVKTLCNNIIRKIPNIQIQGFSTCMKEFNQLVASVQPDLIMMDYSDYINSKYYITSEYKKAKIIFSDMKKPLRNTYSTLCIWNNSTIEEKITSMVKFISKKDLALIRKKVIKMLEDFHFDFKILGTTYLIETILYCYENRADCVFDNLERNVYPYVAQKFHATLDKVKWDIIHTTEIMNTNVSLINQKQLPDTLKVNMFEKTTAKQLIGAILANLN